MDDDSSPEPGRTNNLAVGSAESGQKILQLLERRLGMPQALLHRWIRTGQIRVNGRRCKPFERVQLGDVLRLPPFAMQMAAREQEESAGNAPEFIADPLLPELIGACGGIWAFYKPAGLPVQTGSGHEDAISSRLAAVYARRAFVPVPGHRLDRDTSGVLLVGSTYEALRKIQDGLASKDSSKEYLAWVEGRWPGQEKTTLRHFLLKTEKDGRERVLAMRDGPGKEAICQVCPLLATSDRSLCQIRLLTGRKHQIRAQMAAIGHPVFGDVQYGASSGASGLMLHSMRLKLPDSPSFSCLPRWVGELKVTELPPQMD